MTQKNKRIFILDSLLELKKFPFCYLTRIFVFLAIIIFIAACDRSPKKSSGINISSEEREWLEPFFKELLLEECAIYTLLGSKPITICVLNYYTDEEIQAYYKQMTEEEKKAAITREDPHFEEKWEKWEKIQDRFPMTRYLLYKKDVPDDDTTAFLYFVNILETALTIQRHYGAFKEVVGFDFNSFDMACDIKNDDSPFWKKVNEHAALIGILFGFGEKNAWPFYWKYFAHQEKYESVAEAIKGQKSDLTCRACSGDGTISAFCLPCFMIFGNRNDEMVEKYRKEREEIKKMYNGQDFVAFTLQKLTSP